MPGLLGSDRSSSATASVRQLPLVQSESDWAVPNAVASGTLIDSRSQTPREWLPGSGGARDVTTERSLDATVSGLALPCPAAT